MCSTCTSLTLKTIFPLDDDEFAVLGAHSAPNNQSASFNNHLPTEYNYNDALTGVKLPCEFCEKMIDSENLVLHEVNNYNVLN